ncbi:hypothetical protein CVT24_002946 [Panaeolus cyanescens]|uniref:Uncharacterized protein n=1 Tax=Panaeolus cyanescens TaxID=181874 RepID=A0A409VP84_9AGAR|nr:hypothetical protein CVT24_002946 [Panaeolus cyanescens]
MPKVSRSYKNSLSEAEQTAAQTLLNISRSPYILSVPLPLHEESPPISRSMTLRKKYNSLLSTESSESTCPAPKLKEEISPVELQELFMDSVKITGPAPIPIHTGQHTACSSEIPVPHEFFGPYKYLRNRTVPLSAVKSESVSSTGTSPSLDDEEIDRKKVKAKTRARKTMCTKKISRAVEKIQHNTSQRRPRSPSPIPYHKHRAKTYNRPRKYFTSPDERKAYMEAHPCKFTFRDNITTEAEAPLTKSPLAIMLKPNRDAEPCLTSSSGPIGITLAERALNLGAETAPSLEELVKRATIINTLERLPATDKNSERLRREYEQLLLTYQTISIAMTSSNGNPSESRSMFLKELGEMMQPFLTRHQARRTHQTRSSSASESSSPPPTTETACSAEAKPNTADLWLLPEVDPPKPKSPSHEVYSDKVASSTDSRSKELEAQSTHAPTAEFKTKRSSWYFSGMNNVMDYFKFARRSPPPVTPLN